jgi:predicted unusual protein kinase regulating ubiquinone biosynthesis (AarF/ABC1/UbiB family)
MKNEVLEMTPAGNNDIKPVFKRYKPLRVFVSLVTLVAFIFTSVLNDVAWAVTTTPMLPGRDVGAADGPGNFKELNVDTFSLPAFLGMINDQHNAGEGSKTVIHIQDAHCNHACQIRISEIIDHLAGEYGIRAVNLEGGAGEYDLSIFTRIQDPEIRQKVADYFVKEGLVNGAEFFAINNPEKVDLWGVEDVDLYLANLNAYRDSLKYKDEVERHLKALKHILNNLKRHMYSSEMLEFDMKYVAYKAGNMEFREYLSWLISAAQKRAIDIKQHTNIYLLNQTMEEEEGVDFRLANIDRTKLIHELQKRLSVAAMEELALKTVEFRQERISQKDFYSYLTQEARRRGIDLAGFPSLENYMVYIAMYEAIEKTKIMEELDALESAIRDELCLSDTEKELALLSKHLSLIENLFDVRLTKEDYRYYIHNETAFHARNFKSFIDKHAPIYKITARPDSNISDLDGYRGQLAKFYEYSFKRDEVFLENMSLGEGRTSVIARKHPPVIARERSDRSNLKSSAIIVTGGFHTENLASLFREQGVSYVSIMPKFKSCDKEENQYFALLSGESDSALGRIQDFTYSALAIASFLNENISTGLDEGARRRIAFDLLAEWRTKKEQHQAGQLAGKTGLAIRHGNKYLELTWAGEAEIRSEVDTQRFETVTVTQFAPVLHLPSHEAPDQQIAHAEGMALLDQKPISKNGVTNIDKIKQDVKIQSISISAAGVTAYVDNDILDRYKQLGFNSRKEFLEYLESFLTQQFHLYGMQEKEIVISLIDTAESLFEDHLGNGFIGVHKSLFEKLTDVPLTALKLLQIGLEHELSHEALFMERNILVEYYQTVKNMKFQEAVMEAERFIENNRTNLRSEMEKLGIWDDVEKMMLERDLQNAEKSALDMRQVVDHGLLPESAGFVSRYLSEEKSIFSDFLRDEIDVQKNKFGLIDENDIVYQEVEDIFRDILMAAGLDPDSIKLYLINSDEINAYWITDTRSFFLSAGLIKTLKQYLNDNGKTLTRDMIAWVLAHEVRHLIQYMETKDEVVEDLSRDIRTIRKNKEIDADIGALRIAAQAGYNPGASTDVLDFLEALGGIPYLDSHPSGDERKGRVQHKLASPNQHIPNMDKRETSFSRNFMDSPLIKDPTDHLRMHSRLMGRNSLDEMSEDIDNIETLSSMEEFLFHYYFRMLYDFSSGSVDDEDFIKMMSFIVTANNIAAQTLMGFQGPQKTRRVYEKDWGIPVRLSRLFTFFFQKGPSTTFPVVQGLSANLSREKIVKYLERKIDKEIEIAERSDDHNGLMILRIVRKQMGSLLSQASQGLPGTIYMSNYGNPANFTENRIFSSREEAIDTIGEEWIIEIRQRNDGKFIVDYVDKFAISQNFEYFWEFFIEDYDRHRKDLRADQKERLLRAESLGLREWAKKRYGKLKLPEISFDIDTRLRGDASASRQEIREGRHQMLSIYSRFLAFSFIRDNMGAFGRPPKTGTPEVPHIGKIEKKFFKLLETQYGNKLDTNAVQLLARIQYGSVFRAYYKDFDGEISRGIRSLEENQREIVLKILLDEPPYFLSNMPHQMTDMLGLGDELNLFQKQFASYYFEVILKMLRWKASSVGLDFSDMENVIILQKKMKGRYGSAIGRAKGLQELINYVGGQLLEKGNIEIDKYMISLIGSTGEPNVIEMFMGYLFSEHYNKWDYESKIYALLKVIPSPGLQRNKLLDQLLKTTDYEGMTDDAKKKFLEKLLPLYKVDVESLHVVSDEKKPLHQKLSRDYMLLLKKTRANLVETIRQMDSIGAIVTRYDFIVENQDELRNITFDDARNIIKVLKESEAGNKEHHFIMARIALTKIRSGMPTFLRCAGSSDDDFKDAMRDKDVDFKQYLSWFTNKEKAKGNWIFEGRGLDWSISIVVELMPRSRERDEVLEDIVEAFNPTEIELLPILSHFSPVEAGGELAELGFSSSFFGPARPAMSDDMIRGILDVNKFSGDSVDVIDVEDIIRKLESKIPKEKRSSSKTLYALKALRSELVRAKEELRKILEMDPVATDRFGWGETINGAIIKFAHQYLVEGNPQFDYFNLRDFKHNFRSKKFEYSLRIYNNLQNYFKDPMVSLDEKIKKLIQIFPDKIPFRDNEFEKLIAREVGRITEKSPTFLMQPVNLVGIEVVPYEIVPLDSVSLSSLTKTQAGQIIGTYKKFLPHMTEGTHQIVLGRKIFELQKLYFQDVYEDFDRGLQEILAIFPMFSIARDSVLDEFINMVSVKSERHHIQVKRYLTEEQLLSVEKDRVVDSRQNYLWDIMNKFPSRKEKSDFILWVLNPERAMPASLIKASLDNHVNFDSLPGIIFSMTKNEREKFFHDSLRGKNGLFEVDWMTREELEAIVENVLSGKEDIIAQVMREHPRTDKEELEGRFEALEKEHDLESLNRVFELIHSETKAMGPEGWLKSLGIGFSPEVIARLSSIDINSIRETLDGIGVSDLQEVKEQLEKVKTLIKVSSLLGVGKTLARNLSRLEEISGDFPAMKDMADNLMAILGDLGTIDLNRVDSLISKISELQDKFDALRVTAEQDLGDSIRAIKELCSELDGMAEDIRSITKITKAFEKIGLMKGSTAALRQIETLLNLREDESLKEFVSAASSLVEGILGKFETDRFSYINRFRVTVEGNYLLGDFVDELFPVIFKDGELAEAEPVLRDIFKSIFSWYSPERRILLFNALMGTFVSEKAKDATRGEKVKIILEQMGVIGVKVGQYLSDQPQLLKGMDDVREALHDLKKDAAPFHKSAIFQLIQEAGLSERIDQLQDQIGVASIKQVYRVLLEDGTIAAGKFMRPAAKKFLAEDLYVLGKTLNMLQRNYPDSGIPSTMIDEIEGMIREELDFEGEVKNTKKLKHNIDNRKSVQDGEFTIKTPEVYFGSEYVILEENVNGLTLADLLLLKKDRASMDKEENAKRDKLEKIINEQFTEEGKPILPILMSYNLAEINRVIAREFLRQVFQEGFFHADLHAGNAMITPNKEIYIIDIGSAGEADPLQRQAFIKMLIAISDGNTRWAISLMDMFLGRKIRTSPATRKTIKDVLSSDDDLETKLKKMAMTLTRDGMEPSSELTAYLKALASAAPCIDFLPQSDKERILSGYLTRRSKEIVAAHRPIETIKSFLTPGLRRGFFGAATEAEFHEGGGDINYDHLEMLISQVESKIGDIDRASGNNVFEFNIGGDTKRVEVLVDTRIDGFFDPRPNDGSTIRINPERIKEEFGQENHDAIIKAIIVHEMAEALGVQLHYNHNTRHMASLTLEGVLASIDPLVRKALVDLWQERPIAFGEGDIAGTKAVAAMSVIGDILPLLETPNNHVALISAMAEILQTTEVSKVIDAIDALTEGKRKEKADLHLALRMAGAIEGMRDVDPGQLNVVAQVAPLGVRSPAAGPLRTTERRISRTYNGVAGRSVIGEGDAAGKMTLEGYEEWIQATLNALQDPTKSPRALFLVPNGDRDIFKSAAHKMGILSDDEQYRADLRVQYVDQGEKPDLFTQFLLGVEILDHDRKGPEAEARPGLLRLLSAMVERMEIDGKAIPIDNPAEILKQLFQGAVLITRRIDWEEIRDQYAAWQAVATSL